MGLKTDAVGIEANFLNRLLIRFQKCILCTLESPELAEGIFSLGSFDHLLATKLNLAICSWTVLSIRQSLCHGVTTFAGSCNRCTVVHIGQHFPYRRNRFWTEIVNYIHCASLDSQIPIMEIESRGHNDLLIQMANSIAWFSKETICPFWISKVIFIHDQGNWQWPPLDWSIYQPFKVCNVLLPTGNKCPQWTQYSFPL